VAALARTAVKLVMLLVGAIYVYLQFVGVAFHRKRSMKGRLTTKKAGALHSPRVVYCVVCVVLCRACCVVCVSCVLCVSCVSC
jgi:hypothetical protein